MLKPTINFLRSNRNRKKVPPYSKLALFYNDLMSHVDYKRWAEYVLLVTNHLEKSPKTAIDLACGTGNLAFVLHEMGLRMEGADGNTEMISIARRNSKHLGYDIPFQVCDLRTRPKTAPKDLVICLYDSLNYMMKRDDIGHFFRSVHDLLDKDGLFLFDCSTIRNSITHFHNYRATERYPGGTLIRFAYFDKRKRIQHNKFELFFDEDKLVYLEHHRQRIWPLITIERVLNESGFQLVGRYDGYTLEPGNERCDRIHFAAVPK